MTTMIDEIIFLFTGKNASDSVLPLSHFTGKTTFAHCTKDEDHGCKGVGPSIGAIWKDFTMRNRWAESIMS